MIEGVGTNNPLEEVLIFAFNLNRLQILNDFISQLVFVSNIVVDADSAVAVILQSRKITKVRLCLIPIKIGTGGEQALPHRELLCQFHRPLRQTNAFHNT